MDEPAASSPTARPHRGAWERWYLRLPIKWAVFLVITFFVLFPSPAQFGRHLSHLLELQAMIQPDAPELAAWEQEIRSRLEARRSTGGATGTSAAAGPSGRELQREVQAFVLERVKYEWDWNLWGSADYLPTVAEMFARGAEHGGEVREDCDGRAVMAASLMKRLGQSPALVTDLRHVWVETPEGAWMGPGGRKAMVATSEGTRLSLGAAVWNLPMSLSYGIAVFPFVREMVILLAAFVLMLRRWSDARWAGAGLVLLVQGLLFLRLGFLAPEAVSREASAWPTWVGLVHVALGFGSLARAGAVGRRRAGRVWFPRAWRGNAGPVIVTARSNP
jgi:hypothetical protein